MKVLQVSRVVGSNAVLRVLSGATCLCQVLKFEDPRQIPPWVQSITRKEAVALLGCELKAVGI